MSLDAARGFFRQMIGDDEFRGAINDAETPEERIQLAKDAGFEFTSDELEEAMVDVSASETVGDLLDHDDVLGFTFGKLAGLRDSVLQPVYGNGGAPSFFTKRGQVPMLTLRPRENPGFSR
jgi:predicted ribosomally synthesized peptide with nif11-like leader